MTYLIPVLKKPIFWVTTALLLLTFGMRFLQPVFSFIFPDLERTIYAQESFAELLLAHIGIVALSSIISTVLGVLLGLFVTRRSGAEFRALVDAVVAIGQTFPPVAVLAVAVPLIGFGVVPALIALTIYGLLPIVEGTIAGLTTIPAAIKEAAAGLGMSHWSTLRQIELPLAWPIVLTGIRTSVTINIGTAAIASTVGAKTLGTPIIVGLNGFNTAYVIEGALLVGLLSIAVDMLLSGTKN